MLKRVGTRGSQVSALWRVMRAVEVSSKYFGMTVTAGGELER